MFPPSDSAEVLSEGGFFVDEAHCFLLMIDGSSLALHDSNCLLIIATRCNISQIVMISLLNYNYSA